MGDANVRSLGGRKAVYLSPSHVACRDFALRTAPIVFPQPKPLPGMEIDDSYFEEPLGLGDASDVDRFKRARDAFPTDVFL